MRQEDRELELHSKTLTQNMKLTAAEVRLGFEDVVSDWSHVTFLL